MDNRINNPDWLRSEYESGKSIQDIADILGMSKMTVLNRFRQFDIPRRNQRSPEKLKRYSKTRKRYWQEHPDRDAFKLKLSATKRQAKDGVAASGYRWIYILGRGKVREHRYVMEQHLGRRLLTSEHVHHKDGNKLNNAIENLELVTAESHANIHWEMGSHDGNRKHGRDKNAPFASETHKECCRCHEVKPRSEFGPITTPGKDPNTCQCRVCLAEYARQRRANKA